MIEKFKEWFHIITRSSVDPEKMSTAVRGALVALIPIVMTLAPLACQMNSMLCIDTSQLSPLVDAVVGIVKAALELVAYVLIAYGLFRKLWVGRWNHPDA